MVTAIPPVLRRPQLVAITGLSRATLDRLEQSGDFPQRFKLTPNGRACAWRGDEVARWLDERSAARSSD